MTTFWVGGDHGGKSDDNSQRQTDNEHHPIADGNRHSIESVKCSADSTCGIFSDSDGPKLRGEDMKGVWMTSDMLYTMKDTHL
jgi:hypothetical protein